MNGIIDNLTSAVQTWNEKMAEIWTLLTQSPEEFKGGDIWKVIQNIHGALLAIGIALLVLFFVFGLVKTCTSVRELKRPELIFRLFLRFAIARILVTYGMDFIVAIFKIVQGMITSVMTTVSFGTSTETIIPEEVTSALSNVGFLDSIPLWAVTLLGAVFITVLSFVLILTVYSRFFKLYMYAALLPIPLASAASESTQQIAMSFLKSYIGVCLEGLVIIVSCIIYTVYVKAPPAVDASASAVTILWSYIGETIFNMLILVGTVKMSDRVVKEMMGL